MDAPLTYGHQDDVAHVSRDITITGQHWEKGGGRLLLTGAADANLALERRRALLSDHSTRKGRKLLHSGNFGYWMEPTSSPTTANVGRFQLYVSPLTSLQDIEREPMLKLTGVSLEKLGKRLSLVRNVPSPQGDLPRETIL